MFGLNKSTTHEFVAALYGSLGPRLRSAVLYGSIPAGDYHEGHSNQNLLLLVEPLGLAELETIERHARDWAGMKDRAPLVFTPSQLAASADAFSIEWLDILQSREILHGIDPFDDFDIAPEPLRIQIEHEFHAFVLRLREGYLRSHGTPNRLRRVIVDSVVPLLVLIRASLRLKTPTEVPPTKLEALRHASRVLEFDPMPIMAAHDLKLGKLESSDEDLRRLFSSYLRTAERLLTIIDETLIHPTTEEVAK